MAIPVITEYPVEEYDTPQGFFATRTFCVYASSRQGAREIVRSEKNIKKGSVYEDPNGYIPDGTCTCQILEVKAKSSIEAVDGRYALYNVVCRFEPPRGTSKVPPIEGVSYWWLTGELEKRPVDHDRRGKAIVNTAGEPFDPTLSAFFVAEEAHVQVHISALDQPALWNRLRPFHRKTNLNTFKGSLPKTLFCKPFQVTPTEYTGDDGNPLFLVEGSFLYREAQVYPQGTYPAWADVVVNKGKRFDNFPNDPPFKDITTDDGNPVAEPVLLDAEGVSIIQDPANAILLSFEHYDEIDYANLPFA